MKTTAVLVVGWLLATPALAGAVPAVARQKNWLTLHSPNFTVLGDSGAGEIRRVAERLERFRDALGALFPSAIEAASRATTVVVFRSHRNFEPFKPRYDGKPQSVAGYFTPGEAVHYIALTGEGEDEAFGIIYHEYVHAVVNAVMSSPPVWFNEGLAEYYRTLEVTSNGRQALIGKLQPDHVLRLQTEWLPLEAVLTAAHDSPLYNERNKASVFYAESWALMHYLLLGDNGAYAKPVARFAALLTARMAPDKACQQAFGLTLAELEKRVRAYLNPATPLPMIRVTFSDRIAKVGALPVTPVPDAEAHAALGELLIRLGRPDEARAQLEAALALDGSCAPAHESMGRLLAAASQFAQARDHLAAAIAGPGATWLTHYTYGRVLVQARSGAGSADDDEVARAFVRSIELRPDFADGYAQLAWARSGSTTRLDEAAAAARKATELAPGKDEYALLLAQILANRQEFVAARPILVRLAGSAADAGVKGSARDLLAYIDRVQTPAEGLARATPPSAVAGGVDASGTGPLPAGYVPVFREVKAGEQRKAGRLTRIDCTSAGLTFTVAVKDTVLAFAAARFEDVEFLTYREDLAGQVQCGARTPPDLVLVTYRPSQESGKVAGSMVAVEFPPLGYTEK
jgi:tetratricopeptide (TPR) repeat protein